jgi:hypothetical protein
MAKDKGAAEKGRIKVEIIRFELEGNDASLQEGLRSVAAALTRINGAPPRALPTRNAAALTVDRDAGNQPDDDEEHDITADESGAEAATAATTRSRKAPSAPRSPEILENVDFTSGSTPLKDFLSRAGIDDEDSHYKRYLAVAYWFKRHASTAEVTMDHVYTAFRFMQWTDAPTDAGSPLRDMKSRKNMKWMGKGEARGAYKINHIGENVVEEWLKNAQS